MTEPPTDGILGSVQAQTTMKSTKNKTQPSAPVIQPAPPSKTTPSLVASVEVNAIQPVKYSGGKKKGKNNSKKPDNQ